MGLAIATSSTDRPIMALVDEPMRLMYSVSGEYENGCSLSVALISACDSGSGNGGYQDEVVQ